MKNTKKIEPEHKPAGTGQGWIWCQKCYRSWRIGAKRFPRCAPRTVKDGFPDR